MPKNEERWQAQQISGSAFILKERRMFYNIIFYIINDTIFTIPAFVISVLQMRNIENLRSEIQV